MLACQVKPRNHINLTETYGVMLINRECSCFLGEPSKAWLAQAYMRPLSVCSPWDIIPTY